MEIYVKKHETFSQIRWLNSLPLKYKNEIINQLINQKIDLNEDKQYKIIVDLMSKPSKRVKSQV